MKEIWSPLRSYWLYILLGVAVLFTAYFLLFRGLYGLTNGQYAATEIASQQQSSSLRTILESPVNAPYELLVWLGLKLDHHSILVTRIAAVLWAIPLAALFYFIALQWYKPRVAAAGTLMFITSSGFLHAARYGTAMVLQMTPILLLASVFLYKKVPEEYKKWVAFITIAIVTSLLYVPGMVWLIFAGAIILWRRIYPTIKSYGVLHLLLLGCMVLLLVAPLIYAAVHNPRTLLDIAGIPAQMPTFHSLLEEAKHLVLSFAYHGYWPSEYWLYSAPLLNIAEAVLLLTGAWFMCRRPMVRGNYFLLAALVFAGALVMLRHTVTVALLVPIVYFLIAGGMQLMLNEWKTVFPRNPFAAVLSTGLIGALVLFSVVYHLRAYYIAWPNAPETKAVYNIKQPS